MVNSTPSQYYKKNCFKCPVYEKQKIDNINVCKTKVSNIINNATKQNKCYKTIEKKQSTTIYPRNF